MANGPADAIAGHGVALGRLRLADGTVAAGPDEDATTLAVEAAWWALHRARRPSVDRVLVSAPSTSPDDGEVLLAAARLPDAVPVLRVAAPIDALELAMSVGGPCLVVASDGAAAAALALADDGYAKLGAVTRAAGGPAVVDASRDPRFNRYAGARGLAGRVGTRALSDHPLLALAAAIERGEATTVAGGNAAAVAAVDVVATGAVPGGPTLAEWEAKARPPSPSEARGPSGSRPRGATGVDADGALLWRERRELLVPLGARCATCGQVNVPPTGAVLCRACGGRDLSMVEVARAGSVASYCVSTTLPGALCGPLAMIYADLDDGVRWKALGSGLTGDDLRIGARVELVLRRLGLDDGAPVYGLAFRAPMSPDAS